MSFLVIAHAPADAEAAQRLAGTVRSMGAVAIAIDDRAHHLTFGADSIFAILWSERAAAAADAMASLVERGLNAAFLVALDEGALPDRLAALDLYVVRSREEVEILEAVKVARREPRRTRRPMARPPVNRHAEAQQFYVPTRRPVATPPRVAAPARPVPHAASKSSSYLGVFAGGAARGFASSVAMIGVGGVIAIGAQERAGLLGTSPAEPSAHDAYGHAYSEDVGATSVSDDVIYEPFDSDERTPVLDRQSLEQQAATLRAVATAQRAAIEARLNQAVDNVDVARDQTIVVIDQLDAIASEQAPAVLASPRVVVPKIVPEAGAGRVRASATEEEFAPSVKKDGANVPDIDGDIPLRTVHAVDDAKLI